YRVREFLVPWQRFSRRRNHRGDRWMGESPLQCVASNQTCRAEEQYFHRELLRQRMTPAEPSTGLVRRRPHAMKLFAEHGKPALRLSSRAQRTITHAPSGPQPVA